MALRPQVIKFCYRKSGKDDSSQDPMTQPASSPLSRQSLSTPVIDPYHAGEDSVSLTGFFLKNQEFRKMAKAVKN
nr:protein AMEIOTIC 1-like isoform X2 [Lolium perenne]